MAEARTAVLIVDDDPGFREVWRLLLEQDGFAVAEAGTADDGFARLTAGDARLVVLDLMLPPSGRAEAGAQLCRRIVARRPDAKVIVVSGAGDVPLALGLLREGAYDFLAKPVDPDVLLAVVHRAAARLVLEDRVRELESRLGARDDDMLGSAPAIAAARELCHRLAPTDVPVLLTGESGTGKDVFARRLHARSRRADKPLIAVNCGALSASLLESTLFGHKRGAFTGAVSDAPGLFVEADGGSLFLDELGDLELGLQAKLLRALETGEVLPVGATRAIHVDVRLIAATHRKLPEMIAEGRFRDDLYWRVRGVELELPRLADRPGDLPVLAQHFLNLARALIPGARPARLAPEALRLLESHPWPGNLRELRHEMQRAMVMAAGRDEILVDDLSPSLRRGAATPATPAAPAGALTTLEDKIAQLERTELAAALAATGGNKAQAAQRLGLSRQGFLNKLARHALG
ncbi:MAG TPA: sigma-54 dependent transcriptional regulator [Kofleriaceae bacterium]